MRFPSFLNRSAASGIGLVLQVLLWTVAAAQEDFDVVVRAGENTGLIRNLFGVTCGPKDPTGVLCDLTAEYKRMRVTSVRIHDCSEVGDIHKVFPNFNANTADPQNYDFEEVDRLVLSIHRTGARVLYRLGYSWRQGNRTPSDYDRFASIAKHIVLHYTQGWAGGYKLDSLEWEVWNEANLSVCWRHRHTDYYRFYEKVARAVREAHPGARVGGPAIAECWPGDYQEGFIEYCARNKVPLDFFSWHYYGYGFIQSEPYDCVRQGRWIRSLLDVHGFTGASNYLSEHSISYPGEKQILRRNLSGAAFFLSSLIFMQDGQVDLVHHYRGDLCDKECMGLFVPPAFTPVPRAHAFDALALMQDTPLRLAVSDPDGSGFAALAGKSGDGRTYQVLLSDFWSSAAPRRLRIEDLPPAKRLLQVWSVEEDGFRIVETTYLDKEAPIDRSLPEKSPWIRLYRLTEVDAGEVILLSRDTRLPAERPGGDFHLLTSGHLGESYVILGGVSGTSPGTPLPANQVLPLNLDEFSYWLVGKLHKKGYASLLGTLDPGGETHISWQIDALDPVLKGTKVCFAALLYGKGSRVTPSNAVTLTLW